MKYLSIEQYGNKKCEVNAILPIREKTIEHCEKTNFKDRIQAILEDYR